MFFVLGLCVVLAAMLLLNSIAAVIAHVLWRVFQRRIQQWSPDRAAQTLFLLRAVPTAIGIGSVLFLFTPAYLIYEPRAGHEEVSLNLALVATVSALGVMLALVRGIATWYATSRLAANWLKNAERIRLPNLHLPAYRIEHKFPLIAVVGAVRPRLFIANRIFNSLTPEELSAALDHELGHILSNDNFKRGVMRACRDVLLLVPFGKSIDRAWAEASELAADEYAAGRSKRIGVDLASALVKIARMIPSGAKPAMAAGALFTGGEGKRVFNVRVRRLLASAEGQLLAKPESRWTIVPKWIPVGLTLLIVAVVVRQSHVLATVHSLIEHTVYLLQ